MKKLATILELQKTDIVNDKTGVVSQMCKVTYATAKEETDYSYGCDIRSNWIPGENYEKLKKYVNKPITELIYRTVSTGNGDKYVLDRFADVELRTKN